jgi:flagellar biosynthesis protein FlhG
MARPWGLAVTSGKGGVGKSCVALNLAVALGRLGQRVLLVDADLGLGNLAIMLGVNPVYTFEAVLQGSCSARQAVIEGPEGVALLSAAADGGIELSTGLGTLDPYELEQLESEFDWVLFDTGAGIGSKVTSFVLASDAALFVVTPEMTSVADAYAALKAIHGRHPGLPVQLVVNMAESAAEAGQVQDRFAEIAARFLGAEISNVGYIPLDRYVREAVKRQIPFGLMDPLPPAGQAVERIAASLADLLPIRQQPDQGVFERLLRELSLHGNLD